MEHSPRASSQALDLTEVTGKQYAITVFANAGFEDTWVNKMCPQPQRSEFNDI